MDLKTFVSLRTGTRVQNAKNGLEYLITTSGGCTIASRQIFLNSHELQTGNWLMKSGDAFIKVPSADKVKLSCVLKKNQPESELYVVCGYSHASIVACTCCFITTDHEDWKLIP